MEKKKQNKTVNHLNILSSTVKAGHFIPYMLHSEVFVSFKHCSECS